MTGPFYDYYLFVLFMINSTFTDPKYFLFN